MGKVYNTLSRAKYLNTYSPIYLLELYKRLSAFYDNPEIPFENVGLLDETQVKTHYNPETKTFSLAFESSRSNRVQKKLPLAIDWIINFIALPTGLLYRKINQPKTHNFTKNHRTHAGFSIAFLKIIDHIDGKIKEVINNHQQIDNFEIYGWSYGGAMATMCHGWIYSKFCALQGLKKIPTLTTITIGAPRTYFKIFFNIFKAKHWSDIKRQYQNIYLFSNANDIVTHVPFTLMSSTHVMPRIILEKPFNIIKIFKPTIYHQKTRYDELIINKLTKEIEDLKLKEEEAKEEASSDETPENNE